MSVYWVNASSCSHTVWHVPPLGGGKAFVRKCGGELKKKESVSCRSNTQCFHFSKAIHSDGKSTFKVENGQCSNRIEKEK